MAVLRIFIADDHEMVRRVITGLLAFHPDWVVCGEAADGREAVEKVADLKPDIVLNVQDALSLNVKRVVDGRRFLVRTLLGYGARGIELFKNLQLPVLAA